MKCIAQRDEFSFTIIDEMFRGTGPEHAEVLSHSYAKKLARYPNAIVIESTHYPKLVKLEEETNGEYKNYKMDILQQEDGTLHRPYKMTDGYTLVNIADQILKEQGLLLE
jgi:DNA mismatch repair ATPase MutS